MDKLVTADLQELKICFVRGQKCCATFNLTNLMHTMSVAISLTSTNPSLFYFSHSFSIIQPLSTSLFTIYLSQSCSDSPPLSSPLDTILVRSSMLPTGKAHMEELRRLFSKPGPHVFRDVKIPIVFVGSQVVESLILSLSHKSLEFAFLLEKSVSSCDNSELNSLLRTAAKSGNSYFVSALIDAGADVNCREFSQKSAISLAVKSGDIDSVRVLIEAGYYHCIKNSTDSLILHDAAAMNRVDLIKILCSGIDIDVNSIDSSGQTPLHIAASNGYIEVLEFLINSGSDPDVIDSKGWSPLHYAAQEGHIKAVESLLNHSILAKHSVTKAERKTAFDLALEEEHCSIYDMLHLGDELHRSARTGDIDIMRDCLDKGAKANSRDQNGWTPLHRAAFKGRIECVKLLLSYGAQVDVVDDIGYTPLHLAVESVHTQVALYLIAHGAKAVLKGLKGVVKVSSSDLETFRNNLSFVKPLYQAKENTQIRLLC